MKENLQQIIEQFVDLLMPELTPYEASLYVFFLRNSLLLSGTLSIRIGKRTIASKYGKGPKGQTPSHMHIIRQVKKLEGKGCLIVGDTDRDGTLYEIVLPADIPLVAKKLNTVNQKMEIEDFFTDPKKREELFERDKWTCFYCGEKVTPKNSTLDHLTPQFKGGKHTKENLKTACLTCNSIKSGKTYEEAAPLLLKSIQERRLKRQ